MKKFLSLLISFAFVTFSFGFSDTATAEESQLKVMAEASWSNRYTTLSEMEADADLILRGTPFLLKRNYGMIWYLPELQSL